MIDLPSFTLLLPACWGVAWFSINRALRAENRLGIHSCQPPKARSIEVKSK
jgi:hypothetical protein